MDRTIQLVLGGIVGVVFLLSLLARRFPHVGWLQLFRYNVRLSDEQRAKIRQRANIYAGVELILLGIVLPIGYFVLTVMMFNEPTFIGSILALGSSLLIITLGVVAIWTNRRRTSSRE
ncbi:MAG: hypothetical protein ACREX3_08060 [Gammaproteobacteria bacterium]